MFLLIVSTIPLVLAVNHPRALVQISCIGKKRRKRNKREKRKGIEEREIEGESE